MPPFCTRRDALRHVATTGLLWSLAPSFADVASRPLAHGQQGWTGIVLQQNEGELLISGRRRAPMRIKIDSAQANGVRMSMVVSEVAPGAAIPVHRHTNEDELIFIHTGAGMLTLGDRQTPVTAGAMLYGPRGVWHGVDNTGPQLLTWCAIFSPAGFEQFFKEVGVAPGAERQLPTADQVSAIAKKYGLEFRDV